MSAAGWLYTGPDWYVSTDGGTPESGATGSKERPFSLVYTISATGGGLRIQPGDTIYLRAGTYTAASVYEVYGLSGTVGNPITIRNYPGEAVIITTTTLDAGEVYSNPIMIFGKTDGSNNYLIMRGLTFKSLSTFRGSAEFVHTTSLNRRPIGVNMYASNSQIIGCNFIDCGVSVGFWDDAANSTVYGCLMYNGGWMEDDRGHGHGFYTQNTSGTKTIKHNIVTPHFGRTLACYGTADITGYTITENAWIEEAGSELLMGSEGRTDSITFDTNHVRGEVQGGYLGTQNGSIAITDNVIWNIDDSMALLTQYFEETTVTGNKINGKSPVGDVVIKEMVRYTQPADPEGATISWDTNEYHYLGSEAKMFKTNGTLKTFAEWQAAGFDAAGSYDAVDTLPDSVHVYANEYLDDNDARMGFVVIWNGSSANSVNVDMTALSLTVGVTYNLINALDIDDVTEMEAVEGFVQAVDMRAVTHAVSTPSNWTGPLTTNTYPRFGVFLVERVI